MSDAIVEHLIVDVLSATALALTFKKARLVIIPAHHNKLIKDFLSCANCQCGQPYTERHQFFSCSRPVLIINERAADQSAHYCSEELVHPSARFLGPPILREL